MAKRKNTPHEEPTHRPDEGRPVHARADRIGESSPMQAPQSPDAVSFEELLGELDAIVRRIESGELGLDGSITAFESGVALVKRLQERLAQAEARVRWLVAEVDAADENGSQVRG